MVVKIDKAGRVVIPKDLRDRFRLHPGAGLELEETRQGIVIRPLEQQPSLVNKGGIWVHAGKATARLDWDRIVDHERERRIEEIARR